MVKEQPALVKILDTDSLTDIALIKSALDAEHTRYFIQGENMKFIRPFDPALLMVAEEDVDRVKKLLGPLKLSYHWVGFTADKNSFMETT
jgi:hypothetical protein